MNFWPHSASNYLVPLKYVCRLNPETLPETTDAEYEMEYIDIGSVSYDRGIENRERMYFRDSPSRARKPIKDGDTIIATVRTYLKAIALVEGASGNWVASTGFAVCRPLRHVNARYLWRAVQSTPFVESVVASSTGVSYPAINPSRLGDLSIPLPDPPSQKAIADFLDCETARIDQLIEKKERLIELLAERTIAVLEAAVRGEDGSDKPMRDSGVAWIGAIPAHWTAPKINQVAILATGHTPSRDEESYWVSEECTIPWFGLADVWQIRQEGRVYVKATKEKISPRGLANSAAELLPANTVILSRTASVGFPAIMAVPMATTQDFVNWVCGPTLRPKYLYYVLRAMRREFNRLMIGSTHKTIYMPDVRAFRTPLPPLTEQDDIIQRLDRSLTGEKDLASSIAVSVQRLRALRTALITAAVTGQIDVATWGKRGETDRRLEAIEHALDASPDVATV